MGRRGTMKGRPGLLFILFICICLVVFYFSWRMVMSPRFDQKERNSAIRQTDTLQRSNVQRWKLRQQFDDLQQNGQPSYMVGENQIKMPMGVADNNGDKKNLNKEQGKVYGSSIKQNWSINVYPEEVDKSMAKLDKTEGFNAKPLQTASQPLTLFVNENNFFLDPIKSIQEPVKAMERLVHLDFKGAVPSMKYLKEVLPLFETLGATGLLVEYEDMFPFSGALEPLKAANAFTLNQLDEFLRMAKKYNLKVMPLIQTFGHMEFVLKSAFPELRESSYTPQVIDMTNNGSYQVISAMIQQVLDAHADATHLHIGCDEVYELGKGASATVMQEKKLTVGQMFVHHVKKVAHLVSGYKARRVVPVIWDDMLRKMPSDDIAGASLPTEVEIMVWNYTPNVTKGVKEDSFEKYSKLFQSIWIASSFKGATGSRQFYTEPLYHIKNHFSWLEVIKQHQGSLKFKGVALTGWQRFDHFATLCELLPVALPSLAVCLATIKNAGLTKEIYESTSKILNCDDNIEISFPKIDKKTKLAVISQDCRFPGSDLYYAMQGFYAYTQISTQHRLEGWLSDYQMSHGFSNPGQLKVLAMDLNKQNNGYTKSMGPLQMHLSSIFSPEDVEEWLEENIYERKRRNVEILYKVNDMLQIKTWPKRPLPVIKVGKPRISQQSNFSKNVFETRRSKNSRFDAVDSVNRPKQASGDVDTSKRSIAVINNFENRDNHARTAQSHRQSVLKVNDDIRSDLGISKHRLKSRADDKYLRSEMGNKKRAFSGRVNDDILPEKAVHHERKVDNSHLRLLINGEDQKHSIPEKRNRQPEPMNAGQFISGDNFDKSDTKQFDAQYRVEKRRPSEQNIKQQENQRIQHIVDGADIAQPPLYHKAMGDKNVLDKSSLDKGEGFQSIAKNRQPVIKADHSDFHDAKMERYEDKLIKAAASSI